MSTRVFLLINEQPNTRSRTRLLQVLLSLMNLGSLVVYLSDPMISGFTCGAAVHVFMSQVKSLLGVKVGSYSGPLNIIWVS